MAKKRKAADPMPINLIQIMTVSLFIILLAFFILLNSIAVIDEQKKMRAVGSILESFGGETAVETPSETTAEDVFTDGESPVELQGLVSGDDERAKDLKVTVYKDRTTVSVPENMLFSSYGTRLKRSGRTFMKQLSSVIKSNDFPVDISAHTDDVPVFDRIGMTNRELTALRSLSVIRYLVDSARISPKRIVAYGWGGEKPAVPNKTTETRKMNRRVDITFVHSKKSGKKKSFFIFRDFFFNVKDRGRE